MAVPIGRRAWDTAAPINQTTPPCSAGHPSGGSADSVAGLAACPQSREHDHSDRRLTAGRMACDVGQEAS